MKKEEVASISIIKILLISIVLVIISGIAVIAINVNLNEVKIVFPNGYEISTVTSKVKVSEILETNNIVLKEDEKTIPDVNSEISSGDVINIIKKTEQEVFISKMSKNGTSTSTEDLLDGYTEITEKIIKEQKTIPFETVTKEVGEGDEVKDEVLQEGEDGIKEYTYKVKYQKDVEVEKTLLSEEIIKEPVEKIVQIKKTKVTSRSIEVPRAGEVGGTVGEYQEYAKERCAEYGWSDTDFDCLVALWNKESHWKGCFVAIWRKADTGCGVIAHETSHCADWLDDEIGGLGGVDGRLFLTGEPRAYYVQWLAEKIEDVLKGRAK